MPYPFSLIDKTNFSLALISDFSSLDILPFFLVLSLSVIDNDKINKSRKKTKDEKSELEAKEKFVLSIS